MNRLIRGHEAFVTNLDTNFSPQTSIISEHVDKIEIFQNPQHNEQKMFTHLLEVHLLPVNAFEKLMFLHLWGSACVCDTEGGSTFFTYVGFYIGTLGGSVCHITPL